jgi:hypothetical protein
MTDVVSEDSLRDGRDPDWRIAWEEYLTAEARQTIELAVKRGRRVKDPELRLYAVGLAARALRSMR